MVVRNKKVFVVFSLSVLVLIATLLAVALLRMSSARTADVSDRLSVRSRDFTADEKILLATPPKGASEKEKALHSAVVNRLAKSAEFLDLSTCYGDPLAFRVQEGATFTLRNTDAVSHTLQINPKSLYTIPAKGERKIVATFGFGPGVYGYGCDDSPDARGVLLVTGTR